MAVTLKSRVAALAVAAAISPWGASLSFAMDEAAADKEQAAAQALAGENLNSVALMCRPIKEQTSYSHLYFDPPATKVFDNLYFVGRGRVSAWAINTSAGIILIDTLDNPEEANVFVWNGLKEVGLDPTQIKYIVVTHGHGDHYGGAHELQARLPGARLLMSAADYDLAEKNAAGPRGRGVAAPTRDMVVEDGQKLTLGDETIKLYITPGHTPGTVSVIIPVRDHGEPHVMGLFGGSTFPMDRKIIAQFAESLRRFRAIMAVEHVEGRLSNHAVWDGTVHKIHALQDNPGAPNPYLESPGDMARYAEIQDHCMRANLDRLP